MKAIMFLALAFLFIPLSSFAYDYCETRDIYPTGSCSCSAVHNCSVNCYYTFFPVNKTVYNVYFEDVTTGTGCGTGSSSPYTTFVSRFSKIDQNSATITYKSFSQKIYSISYAGTNSEEGVIYFTKNFLNLSLSIYCDPWHTPVISNSYLTYICYDYYPVLLYVTDGTNPIESTNVSYYYYDANTTTYHLVETKQTDASGSAVLDMCFGCTFKINVTSAGFSSVEKIITVGTNTYTINLRYEAGGFNSIWEEVFWKIEPDFQYLPMMSSSNQTINLTVYSLNNTLEYFSLNLTSLSAPTQLFFENNTNSGGGVIYGSYNNTYSNVTMAKIRLKAVGYGDHEIIRIYYSYAVANETTDVLTLDGLLKFLGNQTVTMEGTTQSNATALFRGILVSGIILMAITFVGFGMGTASVFGASLVGLILLAIFASYGLISWGIVVITGFLIIGLSLIFSGVI